MIRSIALNLDCMPFMKGLSDNYFDLAIADPPYGLGMGSPSLKNRFVKQKNGNKLPITQSDYGKKDWDATTPNQEFFDELRRISKNQIIFGANYFGLSGGMIVWDKLNGKSDQFGCEIIYTSFNKRTDMVYYMWNGMMQGSYCGVDIKMALIQKGNKKLNEKRIHPTQKPVMLYQYLFGKFCKTGDLVFDPMMGSQSSRLAAYSIGLEYIGCELDHDYYIDGITRFKDEIGENEYNKLQLL